MIVSGCREVVSEEYNIMYGYSHLTLAVGMTVVRAFVTSKNSALDGRAALIGVDTLEKFFLRSSP